jgi:hypothetical protein
MSKPSYTASFNRACNNYFDELQLAVAHDTNAVCAGPLSLTFDEIYR